MCTIFVNLNTIIPLPIVQNILSYVYFSEKKLLSTSFYGGWSKACKLWHEISRDIYFILKILKLDLASFINLCIKACDVNGLQMAISQCLNIGTSHEEKLNFLLSSLRFAYTQYQEIQPSREISCTSLIKEEQRFQILNALITSIDLIGAQYSIHNRSQFIESLYKNPFRSLFDYDVFNYNYIINAKVCKFIKYEEAICSSKYLFCLPENRQAMIERVLISSNKTLLNSLLENLEYYKDSIGFMGDTSGNKDCNKTSHWILIDEAIKKCGTDPECMDIKSFLEISSFITNMNAIKDEFGYLKWRIKYSSILLELARLSVVNGCTLSLSIIMNKWDFPKNELGKILKMIKTRIEKPIYQTIALYEHLHPTPSLENALKFLDEKYKYSESQIEIEKIP